MAAVEGALRSPVRDEVATVGFVPAAAKLYRPSPGLVPRSAPVERVRAAGADLITVTAPAGYGKSTFVAEVVAGDLRPTAWISVTAAEDDPAALLSYVAIALDQIEPVRAGVVSDLWTGSPTIGSPSMQRFAAMLADRSRPFVLVLDDVHVLTSADARDVLATLVAELPIGSTVVLVSRTAISLPLGRLRVRRRVVEVGHDDLAFDEAETAALMTALGVRLDPRARARLVDRTEGWPVALYLAALARGSRPGGWEPVDEFAGDHRFLVDYFGEELLGELDTDAASFLMEASCLERASGPLCDDVLQRIGSARLLEQLGRQNLLVISLDDRREWYRFHHLFAEFLQAELTRRDPTRRQEIHRRASEWCDAHGDADGAVTHAVLAGDLDGAEAKVLRWYGTVATAGRGYPRTERWVTMFPPDDLDRRPVLMVVAAWARFAAGDPGAALQWIARTAEALPERYPSDVHGLVAPVGLALARAVVLPMTPAEMADEAAYVYDHVGLGEGHPMACLAGGAAAFMVGDETGAARLLREGADTTLDRPIAVANCLVHGAVIAVEHRRWDEAATAVHRARELVSGIAEFASSALVLAMTVLVETHTGRADDVEPVRLRCRRHLAGLVGVAPWLNLQTRIALARAALIRGNRVEARALLEEAEVILETVPGAAGVAAQLAALRRDVIVRDRTQSFGPSSLTTAELRVLQLLPTHLSVAEIADRLYVSRNTVKSQTIAIYRKLGTSSRGGAVKIAIAAGLLDGAAVPG
jgi:LuxR family maltose regulon positive regulatory protein